MRLPSGTTLPAALKIRVPFDGNGIRMYAPSGFLAQDSVKSHHSGGLPSPPYSKFTESSEPSLRTEHEMEGLSVWAVTNPQFTKRMRPLVGLSPGASSYRASSGR